MGLPGSYRLFLTNYRSFQTKLHRLGFPLPLSWKSPTPHYQNQPFVPGSSFLSHHSDGVHRCLPLRLWFQADCRCTHTGKQRSPLSCRRFCNYRLCSTFRYWHNLHFCMKRVCMTLLLRPMLYLWGLRSGESLYRLQRNEPTHFCRLLQSSWHLLLLCPLNFLCSA